MKIKEFIDESAKTAIYPYRGKLGGLAYVTCGLAGETGECFEVLKKIIRDNDGLITNADRIKSEMGDILWYWGQLLFESKGVFKDEDDTLADDIQSQLYTAYIGDNIRLEASHSGLVYQQIYIFTQAHFLISKLFEEFNKIKAPEEYESAREEIAKIVVEFFKVICIFLGNLDIKISEVMQDNLNKLSARKDAGKLKGSGENLDERG